MNTIFKLFALFCFINVEIVCQVICDVMIDFPALVDWIIPLGQSTFCSVPTGIIIPYNFSNVTTGSTPNYLLTCDGLAFALFPLNNVVSCFCQLNSTVERIGTEIFDCSGFLYKSPISPITIPASVTVSKTVPVDDPVELRYYLIVPVILLIVLLVALVAILFSVIWCLVSRKRSAHYVQSAEANTVEESLQMRSNDYGCHIVNPCTQLDTDLPSNSEPMYWQVNFNDYDYIDEEASNLSFLGSCTNNSEDLYQLIRRAKPVSSEALYESLEDQLNTVRKFSSSRNHKGTVSYIIVPTKEQRNYDQFDDYIKFESNADYSDYASNGDYMITEEPIYKEPSSDVNDLYDQMSTGKLLELNRDTITVLEKIGSGEYGEVSRGIWDSPVGDMNVALKVMNQDIAEQYKAAFLQEAAILGQFSHPNILRLVGVVTLTAANMIVTELMQEELRRFLLALQTQHSRELDYETLAPHFLSFSRQVASGMQHLAERGCIHRDIAARNILLTDRCVCKIADFGMSRRLEAESDYYRVKGGNKVPVKWSAPEAIFFKRFSLKSDVWSYGMLLYEIWSVGRKPWPYEDNKSTVEKLARGANLPPPAGCARAVYELMVSTWHPKPDQRPDMRDVVTRLSESEESLLTRGELEHKRGSSAPAFLLGADPIAAEELYYDLQNKYLNIKVD